MVEISLGSPQMSSDLTKSHLDLPEYCQICITSVRSGGSGFGEENSPLDLPASGLGSRNLSPTVGVVSSGGCRFGFGRVAWVGHVSGWVGHP